VSQVAEISQPARTFPALAMDRLLLREFGFWKDRYQYVYLYALLNHPRG
jgi:hypothetical protein